MGRKVSYMDTAFALDGIEKRYKDFCLGPLNLDVKTGSVVGFVGPNGSGKTTTLRCMGGLSAPDAGRMEILGSEASPDSVDWRQDLAFVSDTQAFYEDWTGQQNLDFIGQFYSGWSAPRASELVTRFVCPMGQKVKTLSKGNRVKLALISALARNPRLLLLDEPTAGLDPVVRSEVLDVLWELLEPGDRTIFYSTHILSDIERLADELVFLHEGQIVQRASKDDLLADWGQISFELAGDLPAITGVVEHQNEGSQHRLITSGREQALVDLQGVGAQNIQQSPLPIDDVAVHILKGAGHVAHRQG